MRKKRDALDGSLSSAFGIAISEIRAERKMKQSTAAAKAGVGQSSLSLIEAGARWPSGKSITAIAAALGVKPSEIFYFVADLLSQQEIR